MWNTVVTTADGVIAGPVLAVCEHLEDGQRLLDPLQEDQLTRSGPVRAAGRPGPGRHHDRSDHRPPHRGRRTPAPAPRRAPKPPTRFRGASVNLLYVPALALFAVFTIYPLLSGVRLSFTNWDGYTPDFAWVGWDNYTRLFTDDTFRSVLVNTFVYGIGSTLIQQVLGLGLALALDSKLRGRNVAKAIIYLPVLVSPIVMGTFYYLLFQYDNGALNDVVIGTRRRAPRLAEQCGERCRDHRRRQLDPVRRDLDDHLPGRTAVDLTGVHRGSDARRCQRLAAVLVRDAAAAPARLRDEHHPQPDRRPQALRRHPGPDRRWTRHLDELGLDADRHDVLRATRPPGYSSAMGVALFVIIAILTVLANTALNRRRLEQS